MDGAKNAAVVEKGGAMPLTVTVKDKAAVTRSPTSVLRCHVAIRKSGRYGGNDGDVAADAEQTIHA